MSQTDEIDVQCDPETGLCTIPEYEGALDEVAWKSGEEIIYVGDPMCSWCWGISPHVNALQRYGREQSIPFTILMGGLRPGGGQEWDGEFKEFLKHHWDQVSQRSGQPFGFDLFDLEEFNYDTEPACRAVVTARTLAPHKSLSFYELVQHHFYVQSHDPNQVEFYRPICDQLEINFTQFADKFASDDMRSATQKDFGQSRQWGVSGFPTVLYRKDDQLFAIARGYAEFGEMKTRLNLFSRNSGKVNSVSCLRNASPLIYKAGC